MKQIIKLVVAVVLLAAFTTTSFAAGNNRAAGGGPPTNQMSGSWEVHAVPDPASGMDPFMALASLTADGQMVVAEPGNTGVGGWRRVPGRGAAGRDYDLNFRTFLELAPGFVVIGTVYTTVTLSANGQEFSGPFRSELHDLDGNFVGGMEGTASGLRLPVVGY